VSSLHVRTAGAHKRASAVFGGDDTTWILKEVTFTGTLGPGPDERKVDDESSVRGAPRHQQQTPSSPWISAEKAIFTSPDKIKKGDEITKVSTSEKFRIVDVRNLPGDPLINFQIKL